MNAPLASSLRDTSEADRWSQRFPRIAGGLYLSVIIGGLFAEGVVQGSLIVPGDAAATVQAIAESTQLWRWGIGIHLLYLVCAALPMYVLLYRLWSRAWPALALLALAFALTSAAVEAAALLTLYVPLAMVETASGLAGLAEEQRHALAYFAITLYSKGFGFALLFFAGFCAATGILVLRSRMLPRLIGAMMILAGVCYFVSSLATVVTPALAAVLYPWILFPCLAGEGAFALWLLLKGVDVRAGPDLH